MPMPKVDVEDAGTLSFPVPDAQIAAIVRRAERAPYGRGDRTIVDTSVRKVWQIAPSKVRIAGKSWEANFETILSKVRAGLGCEGMSVSADLYKLLVYDRDGFFLPHRDTEKTVGMFKDPMPLRPESSRRRLSARSALRIWESFTLGSLEPRNRISLSTPTDRAGTVTATTTMTKARKQKTRRMMKAQASPLSPSTIPGSMWTNGETP